MRNLIMEISCTDMCIYRHDKKLPKKLNTRVEEEY